MELKIIFQWKIYACGAYSAFMMCAAFSVMVARAQNTTSVSLVSTPNSQNQLLAHPAEPSPKWAYIFLPAGYTPLGASGNGVALLKKNNRYYRWMQGDLRELTPSRSVEKITGPVGTSGFAISRQGSIAVTYQFRESVDAPDAGFAYGLPRQRINEDSFVDFWDMNALVARRIEGRQFTFTRFTNTLVSGYQQHQLNYFPYGNGVSGNVIRSIRATSIDKNNRILMEELLNVVPEHALQTIPIYIFPSKTPSRFDPALPGELYPAVFLYGSSIADGASGLVTPVGSVSAGIKPFSYTMGNTYGTIGGYIYSRLYPEVTGWNSEGVAMERNLDASEYFVGGHQVNYVPVFISDTGHILGRAGSADLIASYRIYSPDGTDQSAPNEGVISGSFNVSNLDDNGRAVGVLAGQRLFWRPIILNGQQAYERKFFLQLASPAGWKTDHKVAVDESKIQLGLMTKISSGEVAPFMAVPASLSVDANRDGNVELSINGSSDATSPAVPYRFWPNVDETLYYSGGGGRYQFKEVLNGRWEPWNPELKIIVPRIVNPIPLHVRRIEAIKLPATGPIGFDLMVSDWVAPLGKGKRADFIYEVKIIVPKTDPAKAFESVLTVTFANPGDGIQSRLASPTRRLLELPRQAPAEGYEAKLTKRSARLAEGASLETSTREDQNYFFRVRTVLDPNGQVISALYGKILGDIVWDVLNAPNGHLQFTYYLNPTPLDRNLEFNPKRNLFPDTVSGTNITEP